MKLENLTKSKYFTFALIAITEVILLLAAFSFGMSIGFRRSEFSRAWGDNYYRNFGGPPRSFPDQPFSPKQEPAADFFSPHGITGRIIKLDGHEMVIKGGDNLEKIVVTDERTAVVRGRDNAGFDDLKVDDSIVVIGHPESDGSIAARMIRVFDNK